jgi:hypothetical protein
LDREASIHVDVLEVACGKGGGDLCRRPRHALHDRPSRTWSERPSAEYKGRLRSVGPGVKLEDRLECVAANEQRIDRREEFLVAVGLVPPGSLEEIKGAIRSRDKSVQARADKDRCFHVGILMLPPNGPRIPCSNSLQ